MKNVRVSFSGDTSNHNFNLLSLQVTSAFRRNILRTALFHCQSLLNQKGFSVRPQNDVPHFYRHPIRYEGDTDTEDDLTAPVILQHHHERRDIVGHHQGKSPNK